MAELNKSLLVSSAVNRPLYEVRVNDGGADGGSNNVLNVSIDSTGSIASADLDAAVQALATSLDEIPGYTLTSVKKISVIEQTL